MAKNKHASSVFEEEDDEVPEAGDDEDPREPPRPGGQLLLEEGRFVCRTQCYWRGKLWHPGDYVLLAPGATPNSHFDAVK